MTIYLEDFSDGDVRLLGPVTLDEKEIIDFASRFDPQPFHTDPEAARRSVFGGIIASGWHTAALTMRMLVEGLLSGVASMGSPGVDELRWLEPVRPGDVLRLRVEVLEVRASRSKPDRGSVRLSYEVRNQRDAVVMTLKSAGIIGRRPGQDAPAPSA